MNSCNLCDIYDAYVLAILAQRKVLSVSQIAAICMEIKLFSEIQTILAASQSIDPTLILSACGDRRATRKAIVYVTFVASCPTCPTYPFFFVLGIFASSRRRFSDHAFDFSRKTWSRTSFFYQRI